MLGYVVPDKGELKVREYELYRGYYCGLCKTLGKNYGQLPRMALSYDFTFLSLLLESLRPEKEAISRCSCPVHPFQKRVCVGETEASRYAAWVMLLLVYHNLEDDYRDDHNLMAKVTSRVIKGYLGKEPKAAREKRKQMGSKGEILETSYRPWLYNFVEAKLKELSKLEEAKEPVLDRVMEPFAQIMREVFAGGVMKLSANSKVLGQMGYYLGKWIYLTDAYDDLYEDIAKKKYNPLVYRFEYDPEKERPGEFKKRIKDLVSFNLMTYLGEMGKAADLLDIKKNKSLIDNIIYIGLRIKTENLFSEFGDFDRLYWQKVVSDYTWEELSDEKSI